MSKGNISVRPSVSVGSGPANDGGTDVSVIGSPEVCHSSHGINRHRLRLRDVGGNRESVLRNRA